jgi:ABC-type antimicrobial peptide transport system permease subunit
MKNQFFGIFFYLLYLLAMVRPLVPIMEYYANYDYIANVLCENKDKPYLECNGKCYLGKQLNKVNHDNHDHKSTVPSINFDDYPVSPLDQFSYQIKEFSEIYSTKFFVNKYTSQDYYNSILKPPQV